MAEPTIGVFIATPGRASLLRTLYSISQQRLIPGDDILVVGDGYNEGTAEIVKAFGPPFRYLFTPPTRDWGHTQANFGIEVIRGDYINIQDDDDIYAPRAFDEMREAIKQADGKPILARVRTPHLGLLWSSPGHETLLDGHCLIAPNIKSKIGRYDEQYDGDQRYIDNTLRNFDGIVWLDKVLTLTRPKWTLFPQLISQGPDYWGWVFKYDGRNRAGELQLVRNPETGQMWAGFEIETGLPIAYFLEIIEFACWAAQHDLWTWVPREWVSVLEQRGFKPHLEKDDKVEMVHDWPPTFY